MAKIVFDEGGRVIKISRDEALGLLSGKSVCVIGGFGNEYATIIHKQTPLEYLESLPENQPKE